MEKTNIKRTQPGGGAESSSGEERPAEQREHASQTSVGGAFLEEEQGQSPGAAPASLAEVTGVVYGEVRDREGWR